MFKYETISQREKIKNKDVAKIIDYIERHTIGEINFKIHEVDKTFIIIDKTKGLIFYFYNKTKEFRIFSEKEKKVILFGFTKIFTSNISGIYQSIKTLG